MKTETKIYVGTYAKYNEGSITGDWLTVQDYSDAAQLMEAMAQPLERACACSYI